MNLPQPSPKELSQARQRCRAFGTDLGDLLKFSSGYIAGCFENLCQAIEDGNTRAIEEAVTRGRAHIVAVNEARRPAGGVG